MTNETDSITSILAEKIRHEETLINSRLTWMLTFQGFLFATIALVADDSKSPKIHTAILDVVPLVGAIVAVLTLLGVWAAYLAIGQARNPYKSDLRNNEKVGFGGKGWAKLLGRINSLGIPFVVVISWLILYFKLR